MFDYNIHPSFIEFERNGIPTRVFFTKDSGRLITMDEKELLPTEFTHNAIILGEDEKKKKWIVHNHWTPMKPTVDPLATYTHNYDYRYVYQERKCPKSPMDIVKTALNEVKKGTPYNMLTYNCQQFTSIICDGQRDSSELDKWFVLILLVLFLILILLN